MPWRKWNVIIVLVLANYVVFGLFAAFVFPVKPQAPLSHPAQPTFTPGAPSPQRVGTLSYDFLTPSPIVRATNTSTRTPTAPPATATPGTTALPPEAATTSATTAAPETSTLAPTTAPTPISTSAASAPTGTVSAPALLAPRPSVTATTRP